MARHSVEELRAARVEVEQVCGLLRAPTWEALRRCLPALEAVEVKMATSRRGAPEWKHDTEVQLEAGRVRTAIQRARQLLDAGWAYQTRWNRGLPPASPGYVQSGEPSRALLTSSFSLTG